MAKQDSEDKKDTASAAEGTKEAEQNTEKKTTRRRSTGRRAKAGAKKATDASKEESAGQTPAKAESKPAAAPQDAQSEEAQPTPEAPQEASGTPETAAQTPRPETASDEQAEPGRAQQVLNAGAKQAQEALHWAGETAKHVQEGIRERLPEVKERARKGFESSSRVAGNALGATAEGAGKFFRGAARTTKHTVSVLGTELRKSAAKREINGLYRRIGERYYELHLAGGISPEEDQQIKEYVAAIDSLNAEISDLDAQQNR